MPSRATPLRKKCRGIIDGVESLFLLHVGFGKDGPGGGGLVFLIWLVTSVFAAGAKIGVLHGFAQLLAQNSSVQGGALIDDCANREDGLLWCLRIFLPWSPPDEF